MLRTGSRLKSPFRFEGAWGTMATSLALTLSLGFAFAGDASSAWAGALAGSIGGGSAVAMLEARSDQFARKNHANGWAYVASGAVVLGISFPGFYLSNDAFAKAVYSVGETLGVAAVGYGSYLVLVDDDETRFKRILDSVPGLAPEEREGLARSFLMEGAARAVQVRKIRVVSHGLTAVVNLVNGFTASNRDLKTALFFVGGINALAAVNFVFSRSDEERSLDGLKFSSMGSVDFFAGPVSGVQIHF